MKIINADVFCPDGEFRRRDILIKEDRFESISDKKSSTFSSEDDAQVIDGSGCLAIPGLVDIHFHGCMGWDVCDGKMDS